MLSGLRPCAFAQNFFRPDLDKSPNVLYIAVRGLSGGRGEGGNVFLGYATSPLNEKKNRWSKKTT